MNFVDVHEHDARTWYVVPNEHLGMWTSLVEDLHLERAAGICSSGEVGFFSLLPRVKKELVLIDHSYRSLAIAMMKYIVMRERGVNKAYDLFTCGDYGRVTTELSSFVGNLPERVAQGFQQLIEKREMGAMASSDFRATDKLALEWRALPATQARSARRRLDRVTFLHGDLTTDLAKEGPFDLVYLSNALSHTSYGRDRHNYEGIKPEKMEAAVKPGGYVLTTCGTGKLDSDYDRTPMPEHWEPVKIMEAPKDGNKIGWIYGLYRVHERKEAENGS